jgi:ATP-dependent 26S proteasome regulatory subunit/intein/homing endonuclease
MPDSKEPGQGAKTEQEHVVDLAAKEHWKKGNSFFEESKFEEAIAEYNEAIKVDSKYADAYFNRALTERVTNDFDGAKRDLEVVISLQPKSADAPLLIGDMAESKNDLLGARFWYEKSLSNNPDYAEAKNRLEHIDSLIHMDSDFTKQGTTGVTQQIMPPTAKKEDQKEIIQEGQIKQVAFYKSDVKFDDVIGLEKVKRYLRDNVVLAIEKPELFKKYGKKLGLGLLLYGPPGCLIGDERVILGDGTILKMQDFGKSHLEQIKIKVHQGNNNDKYRDTQHYATVFHKYEEQPTIEIITETGKSIKGTPNHPLLMGIKKPWRKMSVKDPITKKMHEVMLNRLEEEWRRLDEIKVGDRVRVVTSYPCYKESLVKTGFKTNSTNFKGRLPKEVTPELAALFGYIIGDGSVARDGYSVGCIIAEDEIDLLPKLSEKIVSLFNIEPKLEKPRIRQSSIMENGVKRVINRKMQMTWLMMNSKEINRNLEFLKEKRVPQSILSSPNGPVREFLKWLYTADGTVDIKKGRVSLKSKEIELLRDVQMLLLRFGICARIYSEKNASTLTIGRSLDVIRYKNKIGFACDKKIRILDELVKIIPSTNNRYFRHKKTERVVKILQGEPTTVYDVEVPDSHRFVANGVISHNTGKTHVVRAIAGEAKANVIIARVNQIVDMYTGNTEKNLHAIFEQARKNTPCIIFFDELDALGVKRGGGDDGGGGGNSSALRLAVNQFLVEMSGVESNPEGIYVIGATNNPWDIDPALKRSGRFGDSVYIKPPDYRARLNLFKYYTRNKPISHLNYGRLARATMGYSPADIERIADKAAMLPLLHEYEHNISREYTMKDVLSILKDKDYSGSSLDEWYSMVKKDVITKTDTSTVDGKKQVVIKEGKLDPQEKILYKAMVNDIKKNTNSAQIRFKGFIRWWALNLF